MTTSPTELWHPSFSVNTSSAATYAHRMYPSFVLFGDSITQGCNSTLLAALSDHYSRRLDVLNRGFSGYNTALAMPVLQQFFPPSTSTSHVRLMTVFFGANDATVPGDPQHVPLDDYREYLRQMAYHEGVRVHGTKVIFITPPPVDEWQLDTQNRNAEHTAMYAGACREVAYDLGLPCLDLWSIFMRKAGWKSGEGESHLIGSRKAPKSQVLAELLSDGLHLTNEGYNVWFEELVKLIKRNLPDDVPEKIPWVFPSWNELLL
jgi:isoamyl acetate esterase